MKREKNKVRSRTKIGVVWWKENKVKVNFLKNILIMLLLLILFIIFIYY